MCKGSSLMELTCNARLVTLFVRNSFERPLPCLVYLGIKAKDPLEPLLVLATSNIILEFKVAGNVKRVYKKEVHHGRVGIEFHSPPHQILINANAEELSTFLALFYKLMDRAVMERMEYIPILRKLVKFHKPNGSKRKNYAEFNKFLLCHKRSKETPLKLKERISQYLKEIDLPDCKLKEIPTEFGFISIERINLEKNEITSQDLNWLEELPIRKSLKSLNLAENQINVFPSVLTDFQSLTALNFRDNAIETIPFGIGDLQTLKYFNMSGNNLRYLPINLNSLRLSEADLTYNYLTSNIRAPHRPTPRNAGKNCLSLRHLAILSVNSYQRRELTNSQYPRILLESLRQVSKCTCGRRTVPQSESQFYEMLFRVRFALTYKIHPQKINFGDQPLHGIRHKGNGIGNLFLRSHFCGVCEDEFVEFGKTTEYYCLQLLH